MLNIVLMPISLRGPMAYFMAPWSRGAKRKPMPICWIHSSTISGPAPMFTPRASRTSALPQLLETARFPCFATVIPAAATTKAVVVEILKVFIPSPPVPTVSTMIDERASILVAFCLIIRAAPATSSTVSPFIRSAVMKAAIWAGVAFPSITSSMASIISDSLRFSLATTFSIASLIMAQTPFSCTEMVASFLSWTIPKKFFMIRFPLGVSTDSG